MDKLHNKKENTVHMNIRLELSEFGTELKHYIRLGLCLILTYNRHNTLTINVPNLITVELLLFIKSLFATYTQIIRHLNDGLVLSWTIKPFQTSQGSCEWFGRH